MRRIYIGILATALLISCGDDSSQDNAADTGLDTGAQVDMGTLVEDMSAQADMPTEADMVEADMGTTQACRTAAPADRVRKLVVAKPYLETGTEATTWTSFDVSTTGELTANNDVFNMGTATTGVALFTPDGEWGFVAQKDGTIGVFRVAQSGAIEVANAAYNPGAYISSISMDAEGRYLYGINGSFRNVGGGVFRIAIDCKTGALTPEGLFIPSKLPKTMHALSNGRTLLASRDALGDETPNDVHILDADAPPTLYGSATPFTPDEAIVVSLDVTHDEKFVLLGNASLFGANQLGVVSLTGDTLTGLQTFDLPDPQGIVTSPYNNAAIVLATQDDSIRVFGYDPNNATTPFSAQGNLATTDAVLLPSDAVMIEKGSQAGLVFVTENTSIRRLRFETNGAVTDLGLTSTGDGIVGIPGAMGLQP